MAIFDTHCHLNDDLLYKDIDRIINDAKEKGVTHFLVVGWDYKSSLLAVKIATKYEYIYASIGVHPCNIDEVNDEQFNELCSLLNHPKVVALGEIGLDYHWVKDHLQREKQKEWFIKQINIANEYHKPIIVHSRDAMLDTLTILKNHQVEEKGVLHCYGGSVESLNDVINLGFYIGLDGPLTFKNAITPKEVCKKVPLSRLLVETDCPYLTPHPYRGKINEPKYIPYIIKEISDIKEMPVLEIEKALFDNAKKLFHV